jgi:hypothetical protein
MSLSEGERVHFARQLLLTELGPEAHERLLQAQASVPADAAERACAAFALYTVRAGLGTRTHGAPTVHAEGMTVHAVLPTEAELGALAGSPERAPAVALICGAIAATAAVLEAAGVAASPPHLEQLCVLSEEV